jgi:hypothetical protein
MRFRLPELATLIEHSMATSPHNLFDRLLSYAPWAAAVLVGLCVVALAVRVVSTTGSGSHGHETAPAVSAGGDIATPTNRTAIPSRPAAPVAENRGAIKIEPAPSPAHIARGTARAQHKLQEPITPSAKSRLVFHGGRRNATTERSPRSVAGSSPNNAVQSPSPEAAPKAKRSVDVAARFGYKQPALDGRGYTSFFGIEAGGKRFAYVLDRSGSMGDPENKPLAAAKAELLASVERLDDLQQFFLIFYNEDVRQFSPVGGGRYFADDANQAAARRFVESIQAQGGTKHYGALQRAINLRPDVIFLLTDGEPKDDLTADELKRLNRLNEGVAQIHVIQFAQAPYAGNSLVQLARQNRGQHSYRNLREIVNRALPP